MGRIPMARGLSTKTISMIKWIPTSRLSIKDSVSGRCRFVIEPPRGFAVSLNFSFIELEANDMVSPFLPLVGLVLGLVLTGCQHPSGC